jgi:hypothetical protein
MSSKLKELKDEMGTPFARKSEWLINRIRESNADKSNAEEWREKQLLDFIEILQVSAHDLKRAHEEKKIATLAWITRNLLELSVSIEYCEKSDANAKRFRDDAMRDMYGWATAIHKLYQEKSGKDNRSLKTSMENLKKFAATKGVPALEYDFKRVSDAATTLGLGSQFANLNKLYSKFAHPTAGLVHTIRAIEADAEMRDLFFIDGATLALRSLQIIYERIKKWVGLDRGK